MTVIGAGVVGLAVAARLAPRFPELVVLERRARHGTETSSRNSEVIHAGLYYPTGSLKARLCVRGKAMLYELCERLGVPHRRVTKLIVATAPDEIAEIERRRWIVRTAPGCGTRRVARLGARRRTRYARRSETRFIFPGRGPPVDVAYAFLIENPCMCKALLIGSTSFEEVTVTVWPALIEVRSACVSTTL